MVHSDVMMVVAINFDTNKVDLISLPRDTFTNYSGVHGIYKLNGIFNYAGGLDTAQEGKSFRKVCEACEWMLGGLEIDYYCALEFQAVVDIVDRIGGVDYDLDEAFLNYNIGYQHFDGQDVLHYLRVRSNIAHTQDSSRVNRQKRMMVAIFEKLKSTASLNNVPQILSTVQKGFYTNLNTQQLIALTGYAARINPDEIGMHSMVGSLQMSLGWGFSFTDQEARRELIREVYGVTVPDQPRCSYAYSQWLESLGWEAERYITTGEEAGTYAAQAIAQERSLVTPQEWAAYIAYQASMAALYNTYETAADALTPETDADLREAMQTLQSDVAALAEVFGGPENLKWTYSYHSWERETFINAVYVDFR